MSIAIVGRSCLLPGALSPQAFSELIYARRNAIAEVPPGRWGMDPGAVLGEGPDRSPTTRGGYVEGFENIWCPSGFLVEEAELAGLDPLFHWMIHCGRECISEIGLKPGDAGLARIGAIFGNLSFPTEGMSAWGESVLLAASGRSAPTADPRNHFMSGLPAELLRRALGLGGDCYALDAACASSLYAVALAIDALRAGRVDYVIAGAVNRADPLFLHIGFHALGAISPTGQSRPFHPAADGLIPAEGCALVLLCRSEDAAAKGHHVYATVQGVGLSNDGRGRNLLAPSSEGQARALRAALDQAGWQPEMVQYVECHATGTTTGDRTELASLREVYGAQPLRLGSLKSNLGHPVTVAGAAGILKVLAAFERGTFPPMIAPSQPISELGSYQLVATESPWEGPRRAAVSAFGFGGNNAHLVLEEGATSRVTAPLHRQPVAVVGMQASHGSTSGWEQLVEKLKSGAGIRKLSEYSVELKGLRFPPNDLKMSNAQQGWLLQAAREATAGMELPRNRTGVLVGLGCDGPVTGWGLRWRMAEHLGVDDAALRQIAAPPLRSEHVVGTMPNIPANRISVQLDAAGPGFTLSAEELSGLRALEVGMDRLAAGDLDVVVVGAVDLAEEPRKVAALHALGVHGPSADAVVVLVLQRLADAQAQGRPILGILGEETGPAPLFSAPEFLGNAGAAEGLLRVALALLSPVGSRWTVESRSLGGTEARIQVRVLQAPAPGTAMELPLVLSGHALGERLPELSRQRMAPAPTLPPILGPSLERPTPARSTPTPPPVAAPRQEAPTPPAIVASPVAPPAPPESSPALHEPSPFEVSPSESQVALEEAWAEPEQPMDPILAMLEQRSQDLTEIHRRFLEQQSSVHRRFLHTQAQISQHLGVGLSLWAEATTGDAPDLPDTWAAEGTPANDTWTDVSEITYSKQEYSDTPTATIASPAPTPAAAPIISTAKATISDTSATPAPTVVAPAPARTPKDRWAATPPTDSAGQPGPRLSRADLVRLSHEPVENVLGPTFAFQTPYAIVVRMPEPPLLLADRVTGIQGPPCVQGKGTIWTETDVTADAWYLEDGHMPPGVLIETGQADLLLASWQGVDALNKGERAYRLLGCELVYRRSMPAPGDTLRYAIHIDGHAKLGGIRMFFFHYDCHVGEQLQIQIREGQAGFFTVQELGESGGCLWTPEEHKLDRSLPLATGAAVSQRRSFDRAQLDAAAEGRGFDAFGPGFERCHSHSWGPRMGKLKLLDRVVTFDPKGGPWGRGYLKAELDIQPDLWFFNGHFNNDPCMPGTLMFDGCIQAMQLYLMAMGFGMEYDGWRIEPVKDLPFKLICRGQVIPTSKKLDYELFVEGIWDGAQPKLRAQVLCTVDGLKCFHADPLEVELVPDWAMRRLANLKDYVEPKPCEWDYASLIACAWGKPSHAFGPPYAVFDGARRCARLPAPPYHFISRVLSTTGGQAKFKSGATVLVEYDAPAADWYFEQAGGVMPYAVLLETGLQPCGWLASFVGSALQFDSDMLFRNLDGTGRLHAEVFPTSGTIRTRVLIKNINRSGGMIIEGFTVKMTLLRQEGGQEIEDPLYDFETVFGFFPPASFANQVGMPPSDEERALLAVRAGEPIDLRKRPSRYFSGRDDGGNPAPKLPSGMLLMIDRAVSHEPAGGKAGLGRWIVEKDVDPAHWYFKAHFYTDPVQPGSLGIEAMVQSLQLHMIHRGYGKGMKFPRFQGLATGKDVWWRYRGQVVPKDKVVTVELDITAEEADCVLADAWLWVDGRRIYQAKGLAMRVIEGEPPPASVVSTTDTKETAAPLLLRGAELLQKLSLPVPADHCPTWVLPALPMATMAMLALQFSGSGALKEAHALRWLAFPEGPREVEVYRQQERIVLAADGQPFFWAAPAEFSEAPDLPALDGGMEDESPGALLYSSGRLFHGPRFHVLRQFTARGTNGASGILEGVYPTDHPLAGQIISPDVLLDGLTHLVPHDELNAWFPELASGKVGYPLRVLSLQLLGSPPAGPTRAEVRAMGYSRNKLPMLGAWLYDGDQLLLCFQWEEALLPKGPIGSAPPESRRAFLLGHAAPGVGLARVEGDRAVLSAAEVAASDWLPGTVERVYGTRDAGEIAAADLASSMFGDHPKQVGRDEGWIWDAHHPLRRWSWQRGPEGVRRGEAVEPVLEPTKLWWRRFLRRPAGEAGSWPGERLMLALAQAYLGDLELEDPAALGALRGKPVLYLANHETYLESVLFSLVMSALGDIQVEALAKAEHQAAWLGRLHDLLTVWPGLAHPGSIVYFNQQDPAQLPRLIAERCRSASLLVHVEGTRQTVPGQPVEKISSLWVDLATERQVAVVPVAFRGGIGDGRKHDLPQGCARQSMHVGRPILPAELAALPYADRRKRIAERINALGQPAPVPVHQTRLEGMVRMEEGRYGAVVAGIRAAVEGELMTPAERAQVPDWGRALGLL